MVFELGICFARKPDARSLRCRSRSAVDLLSAAATVHAVVCGDSCHPREHLLHGDGGMVAETATARAFDSSHSGMHCCALAGLVGDGPRTHRPSVECLAGGNIFASLRDGTEAFPELVVIQRIDRKCSQRHAGGIFCIALGCPQVPCVTHCQWNASAVTGRVVGGEFLSAWLQSTPW